jgi:hypothetical protein
MVHRTRLSNTISHRFFQPCLHHKQQLRRDDASPPMLQTRVGGVVLTADILPRPKHKMESTRFLRSDSFCPKCEWRSPSLQRVTPPSGASSCLLPSLALTFSFVLSADLLASKQPGVTTRPLPRSKCKSEKVSPHLDVATTPSLQVRGGLHSNATTLPPCPKREAEAAMSLRRPPSLTPSVRRSSYSDVATPSLASSASRRGLSTPMQQHGNTSQPPNSHPKCGTERVPLHSNVQHTRDCHES